MAFLLFGDLRFEVGPDRPDAFGGDGFAHLRDQLFVARQQPRFHQRRHDADIAALSSAHCATVRTLWPTSRLMSTGR